MSGTHHLLCPHCGTLNRIAAGRAAAAARCGACKAALFIGHPLVVDEAGLRRHIAADGIPVLVDVWAEWCGPCRAMAPAFARAAHRLEPRFRLLQLDADRAPGIVSEFAIRSIPTLLLFAGGRIAERTSGAMEEDAIAAWAERAGADASVSVGHLHGGFDEAR